MQRYFCSLTRVGSPLRRPHFPPSLNPFVPYIKLEASSPSEPVKNYLGALAFPPHFDVARQWRWSNTSQKRKPNAPLMRH